MVAPFARTYSVASGPINGGRFPGGLMAGVVALGDASPAGSFSMNQSAMAGAVALDDLSPSGSFEKSLAAETALIGDSLTTHLLGYNWSPFFWINGIAARGGQKLIANAGVAGDTVSNMNSRVDNAYTNASPGLSGLGTLGVVYFRGGTNDARAGTSIASLSSTYTTLLNKIKAYCSRVVILSVPPIGPSESSYSTKNALTQDYNTWLADFAAANSSGFTFVDDSANLRDGTGAQLSGYFNSDGIHNAGRATYKEGIDAAASLSTLFSGYTSPVSSDAADMYPAQPQWNDNHVMAGTGGSAGSGWTGSVANGYSIGSNGSGIGGTLSKEAADGGDSNATPWQRVKPTSVARTGAGESIRITKALTGRTVTTSDPGTLDMVVELRFNSFDTNYFSVFRLWVQGNTGAAVSVDLDLKMGGEVITHGSVVHRIALPRPTATAQSSLTLYWDCLISANNTGAMGSFDFRCLTVRG